MILQIFVISGKNQRTVGFRPIFVVEGRQGADRIAQFFKGREFSVISAHRADRTCKGHVCRGNGKEIIDYRIISDRIGNRIVADAADGLEIGNINHGIGKGYAVHCFTKRAVPLKVVELEETVIDFSVAEFAENTRTYRFRERTIDETDIFNDCSPTHNVGQSVFPEFHTGDDMSSAVDRSKPSVHVDSAERIAAKPVHRKYVAAEIDIRIENEVTVAIFSRRRRILIETGKIFGLDFQEFFLIAYDHRRNDDRNAQLYQSVGKYDFLFAEF